MPPTRTPPAAGVGPIQALDDTVVFTDLVVAIPVPPTEGRRRSGLLQVRTTPRITVPGGLSELVGGQPDVMLGNATGSEWTNLARVVPPPPLPASARAVHEYQSATGSARLASVAPIAGTPWAVWVDYPLERLSPRPGSS